jgi:hypothetical protein
MGIRLNKTLKFEPSEHTWKPSLVLLRINRAAIKPIIGGSAK